MKKFLLLVYLTESYESIWNKIDHLCLLWNFFTDRSMCWSYIGNGEKQVSYYCIEVTICSVCYWCIFRLSLSFTDFISSISEWLTAALKFLKCLLLSRFQSFCMSLEFASISYHLIIALKKRYVCFTHLRSDKIDLLRLRSPISYCKTKKYSPCLCVCQGNSHSVLIWN